MPPSRSPLVAATPAPSQEPLPSAGAMARAIAALEERLARIEVRLGMEGAGAGAQPAAHGGAIPAALQPVDFEAVRPPEDLEFEVGQNWFSLAGILVLTFGVGFVVSLPFPDLPPAVPAAAGLALGAGMMALAHLWRRSFALVSGYLRGASVVLLYIATLRLLFPASRAVLDAGGITGWSVLVTALAGCVAFALWRSSAWLTTLGFALGFLTALVIGSAGFALPLIVTLAMAGMIISHHRRWPAFGLALVPLSYATLLMWVIGNPLDGGPLRFATTPVFAPALLLVLVLIFATAMLVRRGNTAGTEDGLSNTSALLNCALGYAGFVVHTAAAFPGTFAPAHGAASVFFIGLATVFWVRERSRVATFLYAMTGYVALSLAILKASAMPAVFVWLSLQSLVVVATAIWFRSRFIVVANFIIFAAIVLGYIVVVERENGISIGFGIVALLTARLLNWQKDRLELRTEVMRNAYLAGAFAIFPYALHHLVAPRFVALSWIGLAVLYYGLNLIVQNRKYRWMAHATLGLTTAYLALAGGSRFEPVYRIASFLALGTVLLAVSLAFTRARSRQKAAQAQVQQPEQPPP
ncbi:MAG: hypothetical protein WD941_00955 [Opitutus sp.]